MKRFMIVLCVVACFGSPVWGAIDVNFEGPLPSNVSLQGAAGNATASLSTNYNHTPGGTTSALLTLTDLYNDQARVKIANVDETLGAISMSYWVYTPVAVPQNLMPYVVFYVDTANNGQSDYGNLAATSYVITSPTDPLLPGQWTQETVTSSTLVHVVYDRTGLTDTQFSASNGFGSFGSLLGTKIDGSLTWGATTVFNAYVWAGEWGSSSDPVSYAAYVDDINIGTVPEPATIIVWSLLGAASWMGMRVVRPGRRVGRQPWTNENRTAILDIIGKR